MCALNKDPPLDLSAIEEGNEAIIFFYIYTHTPTHTHTDTMTDKLTNTHKDRHANRYTYTHTQRMKQICHKSSRNASVGSRRIESA